MNFMHIIVWIVLVWKYDEMKCKLVSKVFFTMYFEIADYGIWNNHESGVLMNGNVKNVDN
jgi:hypothetical protein